VFVMVFLIGAFGMNFPIFSSTMAVEFGRGAGEYGLLSSILAIGSLTGALLAAKRERARIRVIIAAVAFFAVAGAVSAVMPSYWLFAASTVFIGFTIVTMLTTANGYVQTTTDPLLRGRVMALYSVVFLGSTPIGAPLVGWLAEVAGPRAGLVLGGSAALIAAVGARFAYSRAQTAAGEAAPSSSAVSRRIALSFARRSHAPASGASRRAEAGSSSMTSSKRTRVAPSPSGSRE
jgi:MFS family permease